MKVRPRSDVLFQQVLDEAVLLDPRDGKYFGLNEVGARVWILLNESGDVGAVLAALCREYDDVPAETLRRDLEALLGQLTEKALIQTGD